MCICYSCKFWKGNGGVDCSDEYDSNNQLIQDCEYYEVYVYSI
jgi:hypothetical protein